MQIIPAIDIIEGKCVRLTEGDYAQKKIYNEDPLEVAKAFEGIGLMRTRSRRSSPNSPIRKPSAL